MEEKIMNIQKIIIEKKKEFLCSEYVFGLRGDNNNFQIGDDCHISADPAGESCRGTCAIEIVANMSNAEIQIRIKEASEYGNNVYLICGDDWGSGEDRHERIIHNAEILAIIS